MTYRFNRVRPLGSLKTAIQRTLLALTVLCLSQVAQAAPITISIGTTALQGTLAQLAFDFIDADGPSNSLTISGFTTDGTLGAASSTGGVSGALPGTVTLTDTDFFNELLTSIVLGTTLSFTFDTTMNGGAPPDQFSVFLLDSAAAFPLFSTTDPTGADALLAFDIDAVGTLSLFSATGGEVVVTQGAPPTSVPEPTTLSLVVAGSAMLAAFRRRVS